MEETVTIVDRNILKVLAGETRMDILKELSKGSRTPSDLGKMLGKMDSTIVEHLEALMKVGLVKKVEQPGKKWVFYTLTEKGEAILSKKSRKLVIILSVSIISFIGGLVSFILAAQQRNLMGFDESQVKIQESVLATTQAVPLQTQQPFLLYLGIFLLSVGILGLVFYLIKNYKRGLEK